MFRALEVDTAFKKLGGQFAVTHSSITTVLAATLTALLLAGCATSHVMLGKARAPISPDQVQIYDGPPPGPYQEIARLDTSSQGSFSFTAQAKTDAVIKRLKIEAAKLGANGVILGGFQDAQTGSIGTGAGSSSYSSNSAVGVGVGGSLGIYKKTGHGEAIYVPEPPPAH